MIMDTVTDLNVSGRAEHVGILDLFRSSQPAILAAGPQPVHGTPRHAISGCHDGKLSSPRSRSCRYWAAAEGPGVQESRCQPVFNHLSWRRTNISVARPARVSCLPPALIS